MLSALSGIKEPVAHSLFNSYLLIGFRAVACWLSGLHVACNDWKVKVWVQSQGRAGFFFTVESLLALCHSNYCHLSAW